MANWSRNRTKGACGTGSSASHWGVNICLSFLKDPLAWSYFCWLTIIFLGEEAHSGDPFTLCSKAQWAELAQVFLGSTVDLISGLTSTVQRDPAMHCLQHRHNAIENVFVDRSTKGTILKLRAWCKSILPCNKTLEFLRHTAVLFKSHEYK